MSTNAALELTDLRAEQERERGIKAAQQALLQEGREDCVACGAEIEPERREAMPSARRCVECQTLFERRKSR
ncbi:TraR/DksA C4-type zinc finger protein [Brucella pseudogrignonensis]|uniref:TraR/DksA C4-type zinc finger protein n=1 Tax=Brucella pseudogrignonensis TaxID=419475 RepID=UPI003D95EFE6